MGWLDAAVLGGGGGGGGGGLALIEGEEALSAAVVALVAVTCQGPPPVVQGEFGVGPCAAGTSVAEAGFFHTGVSSDGGNRRSCRRRLLRPFLVETDQPPCPTTATEAAGVVDGGGQKGGDGGDGGDDEDSPVADGVWGGVLDNVGPCRRWRGGGRSSDSGVQSGRRRGWAAAVSEEVWGFGAGGVCGSEASCNFPAYVGFVDRALKACSEWLWHFYSMPSLQISECISDRLQFSKLIVASARNFGSLIRARDGIMHTPLRVFLCPQPQ